MVTSSEKAALSMQSWVGMAVGDGSADVSTDVGDGVEEMATVSVEVGLGATAVDSVGVGDG
jgi:hypothetical protein